MHILDSHVHFIDPQRPEGVVWPAAGSARLKHFMPEDLTRKLAPQVTMNCIAVETSRRPLDDDWLLRLASTEPAVAGVVLNLQPDLPNFNLRLSYVQDAEKFLGVRLRPIGDYDLSSAILHTNLSKLESREKCVEFGARTIDQKLAFIWLANQFPGTSWILDHGGHPHADSTSDAAWLGAMERIAAQSNTYCKVTGPLIFDLKERATLTVLRDLFGARRLLFGSNAPVYALCAKANEAIIELVDFFGEHAADVFGNAARRAYGIPATHSG